MMGIPTRFRLKNQDKVDVIQLFIDRSFQKRRTANDIIDSAIHEYYDALCKGFPSGMKQAKEIIDARHDTT